MHNKYGIRFSTLFLPIGLQIVTGFASFLGIRKLCENYEALNAGGDFWFTNLSLPDPTYGFATVGAATMILNALYGGKDISKMEKEERDKAELMKKAQMGLGAMMVPFSMMFPAGVAIYLCTTSVSVFVQSMFLKIPSVKQALIIGPAAPKRYSDLITTSSTTTSTRTSRRNTRNTRSKRNKSGGKPS